MEFISHIFSGSLSLYILRLLSPTSYEKTVLLVLLAMVFASLPDIDAVFGGTLKDHHRSPLHKPAFWVLIVLIGYLLSAGEGLFSSIYVTLLAVCIAVHLITDTITARTTGISWFYPFSKKEYSLYTLQPEKGDFNIFKYKDAKFKAYRLFYLQKKGLIIFEYSILTLGIVALFL